MFGFDFGAAESPAVGAAPARHAATTALLARMTTSPSSARCDLIDQLIVALVAAGVWAKLDVLHVIAAHDAQAALLNWKGDSANLTVGGGAPVFVADRGYFTDGVDDYLDWNWAPANGVNYTQNGASIGAWLRSGGQRANAPVGSGTAAVVLLSPRNATDKTAIRLNQSATSTSTTGNSDGYGLVAADRAASNSVQIYRQGLAVDTAFTTASASSSNTVRINSGRTNSTFVEQQFCAQWAGGHLTAAEHLDLYIALSAYLTAVGVVPLTVQQSTRPMASAVTMPDGTNPQAAGKGYPCTGLALDAQDGSWWGSWGLGTASANAGVVHLSADFSMMLAEITASSLGLPDGSVQGIAYDTSDNTIWFILKNTASGAYLVHTSKAGTLLSSTLLASANANGLGYDSLRDQLLILDSANGQINWCDKAGAPVSPVRRISSTPGDQVTYDAANDDVLYTWGANGVDGKVERWRVTGDYGGPWKARIDTLTGANAIEGVVLTGGNYVIANDGLTHNEPPALNRALTYPAV